MADAVAGASYPGSGQVVLLCEGDLAGYEAAFWRRWVTDTLSGQPLVSAFLEHVARGPASDIGAELASITEALRKGPAAAAGR